jgi:flagellar motor switch protein FliN/FliY
MSAHPPTAQVIAFSEIHDSAPPSSTPVHSGPVNPLHQVKARLQVCVGDVVVSVGELMTLREQQVLTLNQAIEAPVDVLLEGRVVARGQLMAVDEQFAVRITELPVPLKP